MIKRLRTETVFSYVLVATFDFSRQTSYPESSPIRLVRYLGRFPFLIATLLFHLAPMNSVSVVLSICLVALVAARTTSPPPMVVPPCPQGSRPLLRPDGQPRKCLPHQNSLCVNALPDKPDANTVCCYNNQVDYFCCLDTSVDQCPDYHQVTVVIHNSVPQNPFAMRSFFFREGIEDDVIDAAVDNQLGNEIRSENGVLVRHPIA